MIPLIQQVVAKLQEKKITRDAFADQLIPYLGVKNKHLQGTGEERRATTAWKSQIYRWLSGKVVPRPDMEEAMSKWLKEQ